MDDNITVVVTIKRGSTCADEDCDRLATEVVYDTRTDRLRAYCDYHAECIVDMYTSEYVHSCRACGCVEPVG